MRARLWSWLYLPADLWIRMICVITGIKCRVHLDFSDN